MYGMYDMYVCMVCLYIYMYVCMVSMYLCMCDKHVCIHLCMVCLYTCMYVCTYAGVLHKQSGLLYICILPYKTQHMSTNVLMKYQLHQGYKFRP
jgi:hypothetical protein